MTMGMTDSSEGSGFVEGGIFCIASVLCLQRLSQLSSLVSASENFHACWKESLAMFNTDANALDVLEVV